MYGDKGALSQLKFKKKLKTFQTHDCFKPNEKILHNYFGVERKTEK